ncbi:MAG: GNAT family N-acetyltransferase [Bacteroidales bacterium]
MSVRAPLYQIADTSLTLQKVLFVRGIVFCEEQGIAYEEDIDGCDEVATHVLVTIDNEPIGAARLRVFDNYAKMERIAVRKSYRGRGVGKQLLAFMLNYLERLQCAKVKIHAQAYLLEFYQSFGFVASGEMFLEASIEHYYMEKSLQSYK